jgi:hypothetical protein
VFYGAINAHKALAKALTDRPAKSQASTRAHFTGALTLGIATSRNNGACCRHASLVMRAIASLVYAIEAPGEPGSQEVRSRLAEKATHKVQAV